MHPLSDRFCVSSSGAFTLLPHSKPQSRITRALSFHPCLLFSCLRALALLPLSDRTLSFLIVLMKPKVRGLLRLNNQTAGSLAKPVIDLEGRDGWEAQGKEDLDTLARAVHRVVGWITDDPDINLLLGPGGPSHPHLNGSNLTDVRAWLDEFDWNHTRMLSNHWAGELNGVKNQPITAWERCVCLHKAAPYY